MALLTKAAILQAVDLPTETVEIPEWGGAVLVRGLTGAERDAFEASVIELRGKERSFHLENIRAKLAALSMVGDDGERLFSDREVSELGKKSAQALQRVFSVAQRLSGLTEADIEELTKN